MIRRLLSPRLLHLANANAHWLHKDQFYALKKRLLERFGGLMEKQIQHIAASECWTCDGTGIFFSTGRDCRKCGGSGKYGNEFWVILDRYEWGRYSFHVPYGDRIWHKPLGRTEIEGRIRHREVDPRESMAALLWLALLWDWPLFRRSLRSSCFCTPGWRPILWLQCQCLACERSQNRVWNRLNEEIPF